MFKHLIPSLKAPSSRKGSLNSKRQSRRFSPSLSDRLEARITPGGGMISITPPPSPPIVGPSTPP
jgi:hypothetical protein